MTFCRFGDGGRAGASLCKTVFGNLMHHNLITGNVHVVVWMINAIIIGFNIFTYMALR